MAEEDKKVEEKTDADAGVQVDKLLNDINCKLDSLGKRMDSYDEEDKKKEDGEVESEDFEKKDAKRRKDDDEDEEGEVRRDKKRKDGEMPPQFKKDAKKRKDDDDDDEEGDDKEKADKRKDAKRRKDDDDDDDDRKDSRSDSDTVSPAVQRALDAIKASMPKQMADADYEAMATAQSRADSVFSSLGKRAPRPLDGESLLGYRRRLAGELKTHSKTWKDINLLTLADDALPIAEGQIYADAELVSRNPIDLPDDALRAITRRDDTGRNITEFAGKPSAWMGQFSGSRRRVAGIRTKSQ